MLHVLTVYQQIALCIETGQASIAVTLEIYVLEALGILAEGLSVSAIPAANGRDAPRLGHHQVLTTPLPSNAALSLCGRLRETVKQPAET
jgi:hypothetical protein